jgi:hypothetical protein
MTTYPVEVFSFMGIGIAVVMLRTYVRVTRHRGERTHLAADDVLMICALIPYTVELVLAYFVGKRYGGLTNGAMSDEYRATLSPHTKEFSQRVSGSKVQIAGWIMYVTTLWLIKASLCAFYSRLTDRLPEYRLRIYIGYAAIAMTYIATLLVILCSCHPIHRFWQINPNPGNHCQPAQSKPYVYTVMVLNVATDLYLISVPLPLLWGAHLPLTKKLGLTAVFSGAFFVMAAGIVRGVLIVQHDVGGPERGSAWAARESFVAIVTSNLPPMWGWISSKFAPCIEPLLSSLRSGDKLQGTPDLSTLGDVSGRANANQSYQPQRHHYGVWRGDVSSHIRSSMRVSHDEAPDTLSEAKEGSSTMENGTQSTTAADGGITKRVVIEMERMPIQDLEEMPVPTDLFDAQESTVVESG